MKRGSLNQPRQQLRRCTRGVTLIEFAYVFPILILFVVALVDFARVLAIKAILTKGAENGLNMALKIPSLDVDLRTVNTSDAEYQWYMQARDIVLNTALELPLSTLVTASTVPSSAQLIPVTYTDPNSGGSSTNFNSEAAMLRPGERVRLGVAPSTSWFEHKTFPPRAGGVLPSQSPQILLKSEPVILELRAKIQTFTPFIGDLTIVGTAMGFREDIPRGPLTSFNTGSSGTTTTTVTTSSTTTTISYTTTTTLPAVCIPKWDLCIAAGLADFPPKTRCPDTSLATTSGICACVRCSGTAGL